MSEAVAYGAYLRSVSLIWVDRSYDKSHLALIWALAITISTIDSMSMS